MLLACPFCREMYTQGERKTCSVCGVRLIEASALPKNPHDEEPVSPDEERLPALYFGRGRGLLLATALAGMGAFMLPWVVQRRPEPMVYTGFELARYLGWMWAPPVAWMVLFAVVFSRRSIYKMRGARVATAFLSGMVLISAIVRATFLPTSTRIDPVEISFGPGLYLSGLLGVVGVALSFVFGGRIDDLPTAQKRPDEAALH